MAELGEEGCVKAVASLGQDGLAAVGVLDWVALIEVSQPYQQSSSTLWGRHSQTVQFEVSPKHVSIVDGGD